MRRIKRATGAWMRTLGLEGWSIELRYFRDSGEFPFAPNANKEEGSTTYTYMICTANWPYMQAELGFNILHTFDLSDKKHEEKLVHEFAHVLVSEMRPPIAPNDEVMAEWQKHEERVCQMLAKALINARADGVKEGRRLERETRREPNVKSKASH